MDRWFRTVEPMTNHRISPTDHDRPLLVRAQTAETLDADPTSVITLLADVDQTGGRFTSNRSRFAPGSAGAPPHFHTLGTEIFFVIDGAFQVLLDDVVVDLGPGDLLAVPPGVHHAFGPAPEQMADVLVVFAPGRERFEYYRLLDRAHRGEVSFDEIAATQDRFDNHYVDSPVWEQRS